MGADLDLCDAHVSIKNGITQKPYLAADGRTSLDLPYESCEWTEIMYEPKVSEISSGKIVLPSLIAFPELRPLLQQIQEGDRVEIFDKQPDCGDPVMAAFIPPNGITEADGKTTIDWKDTMVQLQWQHLRRTEYLSAPASGLYDRARSIWVDQLNEDFTLPTWVNDYTLVNAGSATPVSYQAGGGYVKFNYSNDSGFGIWLQSKTPAGGFTIYPGDFYLMEADVTFQNSFAVGENVEVSLFLAQQAAANSSLQYNRIGSVVGYVTGTAPNNVRQDYALAVAGSVGPAPPQPAAVYTFVDNINVDILNTGNNAGSQTAQTGWPMPATHHIACYVSIGPSWSFFGGAPWLWSMRVRLTPASSDYASVSNWRVRQLMPRLLRAARFNPQTPDALTYQPNNEDNLQFLQLVAEKDNAEYRPIYHAWPQKDELELDAVSTLGKFASRTLGYEQPSSLPTEGSPQVSPLPVVTDLATFLIAPPLRFEEGFNLESAPKVLARANAHANDVIRVGASSIDSQTVAEKWSTAETGRPQHSPSGALFPYFEQITNDDRVGIQSLVATLAGFELTRRIDTTPSLEIAYVEEIPWGFRWRAGDQIFTKTLSLRANLEQELRVQKVQYKAGSPLRTVTAGKTEWDPTMLRMLAESMKISWLYEQSGTNPGIYIYPSVGNILSGNTSAAFSIPLDQYTTGSALIYAAIHWFADANVLNVQPVINSIPVGLPSSSPSGTDSGLVIVTGFFQRQGTYQLQFKNNDAGTRNLTGAFLVLRIKG
jgi:hypothetical protein